MKWKLPKTRVLGIRSSGSPASNALWAARGAAVDAARRTDTKVERMRESPESPWRKDDGPRRPWRASGSDVVVEGTVTWRSAAAAQKSAAAAVRCATSYEYRGAAFPRAGERLPWPLPPPHVATG